MPTADGKLTYTDYEKISADGHRHEILGGEEYMTPAPEVHHQRISRKLLRILDEHASRQALGEVFHAPIDVVLSQEDVVQPDIVFIGAARASIVTARNIQGAPDIIAEILSPSTATVDRGPKLSLYERAGVREYWLVDPPGRTVEVRELGKPRRVRVYKEGQSFESSILPGLTVRVSDLF